MTTTPETMTLAGTITGITTQSTRNGTAWAECTFTNELGAHALQFFPQAYADLSKYILEEEKVMLTCTPTGMVKTIEMGGQCWTAPEAGDPFDAAAVVGLDLPCGPDPLPLARVLVAIKRNHPDLFREFGGYRTRLPMLLFFMQAHRLDLGRKPLFDAPIYATEAGVTVDLPEPDGDFPPNAQWGTIGWVMSRYGHMDSSDLRSLIRITPAWQQARQDLGGGEISHDLLIEWFRRDEEHEDPHNARPTRSMSRAHIRSVRAERSERRMHPDQA